MGVVSTTFQIALMPLISKEGKTSGSPHYVGLRDAPTFAAFQTSLTDACFGPASLTTAAKSFSNAISVFGNWIRTAERRLRSQSRAVAHRRVPLSNDCV